MEDSMRSRSKYLAALCAACALFVVGCGGDDDDSSDSANSGGGGASAYGDSGGDKTEKEASGGGGAALKLTADPSGAPKFDKTTLKSGPGKTKIVLDNPSTVPHAIEVEGKGVEAEGDTVTKGGVSQVTVDLKAGKYEYYCPVDGHKDAGMEGTLTVG
jgi:plastocyanin